MKNGPKLAILIVLLAVTGCVNHISDDDTKMKAINFSIGYTTGSIDNALSRAVTNIGDYAKELRFYDYVNGEKKQEQIFSSTDNNFGNIEVSLTSGIHRLIFIAHNSDIPTFSYPELSFDKAKDTFYYSADFLVDDDTEEKQNISLSRAIGKILITATDAIPASATGLRITIQSFYPSFNVVSGISSGTPSNEVRTFFYTDSNKGVKNSTYTLYCFANNEKYYTDVTIDLIGENNKVLHSSNLTDVPVKRNTQTKITGTIFSFVVWSSITIQSDWDDDITYPIGL